RFDCDWSSDVCSSDLVVAPAVIEKVAGFGDTRRAYTRPNPPLPSLRSRNQPSARVIVYAPIPSVATREAASGSASESRLVAVGQIGRASCRERVQDRT